MAQVEERLPSRLDLEEIVDTLQNLIRGVNTVEFGHPQDPNSPASTTLAGGTGTGTHNGTPSNVGGSWVELEVTALNTAVVCRHNLFLGEPGYVVPVAGSPNVRWLLFSFEHDGTGVVAGVDAVSCNFQTGDTVGANSIELRFYAAGTRIVDGTHPLKVTLFFTKAVRGV